MTTTAGRRRRAAVGVGRNNLRRTRSLHASSAEVARSLAIPRTKAARIGRAREYNELFLRHRNISLRVCVGGGWWCAT